MSQLGEQLIGIVRAKAVENPDFVYVPPGGEDASCVYVHEGAPSCLIGQALWDVGLIDGDILVENNEDVIQRLALSLPPLDEHELRWLSFVQLQQDQRISWGVAVAAADGSDELLV